MLLPSDVARLVLGYLQEEGLSATSRAFIHESPNLREYAEHSTEDGTIPACVFSIFGKGLTTILNEYVAVKTKESNHQVPAMMTSLWKKLDFTLNQIKSLQNSPAISSCQRMRTRVGLANMARQRALTAPAAGVVCSTVSETVSIISPAQTSHCVLTHSTPVSYSSHIRLTPSNVPLLNTPRESPVNAVEHRLNPGLMSPGRRKWKRSGALPSSSGASRPAATSNLTPEPGEESEEIVDENFPQLVIQNARDKILGDRSLQEKLAENINKILSSEPTPQPTATKASTNVVEPDHSIDEILGLQGEIHMSDDAIHDILEQTESDPAFQALFDLFDYNKTRSSEGEPADGDISSSPEESELPGPSSVTKPSHNLDSDTTQKEATDPVTVKAKAGLERKTRKPAPLIKTIISPSNRTSRLENCSAKLLVMHSSKEQCQTTSSTKRKDKSQIVNTVTPMDIDEPQTTVVSTITNISTTNVATTSAATYSTISSSQVAPVESEAANSANVNKQNKGTRGLQTVRTPTSNVNRNDSPLSNLQSIASITAGQCSSSEKDTQRHVPALISSKTTASSTILSVMPPPNSATPTSASPVSVTYSAATPSASPILQSSVTASTVESDSSNTVADGNIVSLKIIISDNQEEQSSTDKAMNQAISSISADKIPTIYLSSPAKSPLIPGTPKSNQDEAAQAVSCLQRSESVIASPLTGTSQTQPSYIIQLPFDGSAPSPASYFLVTEPPTTDAQARQTILPAATVSKGQPIAPSQFGVTSQAQAFPAGSALILPSPMKPMVLPYSVVGQNTLGNMQMVPNQIVAIPNPSVVQHPETTKPQTSGVVKPSAGPEQNLIDKVIPSATPNPVIPNTSASPSSGHRRILCFDSSGESQTSKTTTSAAASTTSTTHQPPPRTKPTILGGNKPKRRIETVRCSEPDKSTTSQPTQKDTAKKASRKQEHSIYNDSGSASSSNSDNSKPLETRQRSKSTDKKHNHDIDDSNKIKASDSHLSRSVSLESSQKSGSKKEKEATDKAKTREGRTDKRTQETTRVTANKENELKGSVQELATSSTSATIQSTTQPKTSKTPSKTSSLAKQAAEMLQDIQALRSPSTPKCAHHNSQEEGSSDCPKTPSQQRRSKDGESTPRHLMPPSASDVPSCSPASEAGSESSINMAAHTLMILSRAAMARTGTPLKNSLRQEGAGEQSPTSSKSTKKRKQPSPASSPPAKKESKRTPSKKKEKKKLVDCFPHDLDVDKFLSSLHYDE